MGAQGLILLDTHVLIWLTMEPARIGESTAEIIRGETIAQSVLFSPISTWEVSMLVDKRKLDLGSSMRVWVKRLLVMAGVNIASLTPEIAAEAGELLPPIHGDPADRIIIATARALGCPLITADRKILAYAAAGHVRAIDARR